MQGKEKQPSEVIIRNDIALDSASYQSDSFRLVFTPSGIFKLYGYADRVEIPPEEKYVGGVLQKDNGNGKIYVTRLEQFEIVISPSLAVQLYNLLGGELKKYGIPTELPKNTKEELKVEVKDIDLSYR